METFVSVRRSTTTAPQLLLAHGGIGPCSVTECHGVLVSVWRRARAGLVRADEQAEWADYNQEAGEDADVVLAQATQGNSNNRGGYRTAARSGRTSRVPYMIGDSPFSSSSINGALAIEGLPVSNIEHPIFGGGRSNVAENNSVMPDDRVLFDYRHFHNATETNVLGATNNLDIERFVVGFEKSMFDGLLSAQLSVPLVRQLNSDLQVYDDGFSSVNVPVTDRHGEFGNMAVALKTLLCSRSRFAFSGGVAVNIPTADDAQITQYYNNPGVVLLDSPLVSSTAPTSIFLDARFDNDTVNLVPFFAWSYRGTDRFFHQGFVQVDTPLNRSDAQISVSGEITPDGPPLTSTSFNVTETRRDRSANAVAAQLGLRLLDSSRLERRRSSWHRRPVRSPLHSHARQRQSVCCPRDHANRSRHRYTDRRCGRTVLRPDRAGQPEHGRGRGPGRAGHHQRLHRAGERRRRARLRFRVQLPGE